MALRIAVVGLGKIAYDQHLPAIAASTHFKLVAAASLAGDLDGVPVYRSVEALLAAGHDLDAIAMCQPPQARFSAAVQALASGCHVLLEKPPGATSAEIDFLDRVADREAVSLFAAWHSRFAEGVGPARQWLATQRILSVAINWKEDVRRWHPGQQWIWQPGGLGVFDPGINALSIATSILPTPFFLKRGLLEIPGNRAAPIAADLLFETIDGAPVTAVFDWRQEGEQTWEILVETAQGRLELKKGGAQLVIDGVEHWLPPEKEYRSIYAHFAMLISSGISDVDLSPWDHVADAFLLSGRKLVDPFID